MIKIKKDQTWSDQLVAEINKFALKGDYRAALNIAKQAFKKFPKEFVARYQYAKILGDYADELSGSRKSKMKKESIQILKPLLRTLSGKPVALRFGICLNYYYQSENFIGMYRFSKKFAEYDQQKSFYGMGLAAALIAQEYSEAGARTRSLSWADKSVANWKHYKLKQDRYYFAHYSAAKAYALAAKPKAARKHLMRASKLAHRPITDWEFADVYKLVEIK